MRSLARLIGIVIILVGVVGVVWPESLLMIAPYSATAVGLWVVGVFRVVIGVVFVLVAPVSRTPRILRVLGVIVIVGGLTTPFLGVARARAIMEWWSIQGPAFIRAPAVIALVVGGFVAYAVAPGRLSRVRE